MFWLFFSLASIKATAVDMQRITNTQFGWSIEAPACWKPHPWVADEDFRTYDRPAFVSDACKEPGLKFDFNVNISGMKFDGKTYTSSKIYRYGYREIFVDGKPAVEHAYLRGEPEKRNNQLFQMVTWEIYSGCRAKTVELSFHRLEPISKINKAKRTIEGYPTPLIKQIVGSYRCNEVEEKTKATTQPPVKANEAKGSTVDVSAFKKGQGSSTITVQSSDTVDFILIDPAGRKVGDDPQSGESFRQIPGQIVKGKESIDSVQEEGKGAYTPFSRYLYLPHQILLGRYQVKVIPMQGSKGKAYSITVNSMDKNGNTREFIEKEGVLSDAKPFFVEILHSDEPLPAVLPEEE